MVEAGEAVARRHFLGYLHDHKVLVDLRRGGAEVGGELVLVGRDLKTGNKKEGLGGNPRGWMRLDEVEKLYPPDIGIKREP